ncbi:hypothetical protein BGX29_008227 [Mortierella sp. GBA35]|nr:hypothetical protein BGX29_008227 [Mortierella sp. GBA35]
MGSIGEAQGVTRYTIGILALLSVVCIWVSSSFLMNNIFAGQKYNKPFFVTYVNTASFSLYLLGPLFRHCRRLCSGSDVKSTQSETTTPSGDSESLLEQGSSATPSISPSERPLTHWEIAELSFAFCVLWFAANWCTNASLAYTTVASSTILASMSGFFTLAIGSFLKTESFSTVKLIAVSSSLLGVALVSNYDRGSPNVEPTAPKAPLFGDILALGSALFYGCYTVLLKIKIQNESRVNMSLFFGFVGLFNLVLLWPIFGVLHWTGIEPFELPHDSRIVWMIGINAFVGTFVSDYLWLLSMLMTSPLVVTLGLSMTIPLALLGDIIGYGRVLGVGYWIGAGLVLAGFFGVNGATMSERNSEMEDQDDASVAGSSLPAVPDETQPLLQRPVFAKWPSVLMKEKEAWMDGTDVFNVLDHGSPPCNQCSPLLGMQSEPPPYSRRGPSGPPSPTSPLSTNPRRSSSTASTASSTHLCLPDDYNPLQYPPPSRVRVGVKLDIGDASDLDDADNDEQQQEPESEQHVTTPTPIQPIENIIGAFHTSTLPKVQNIQGVRPHQQQQPASPGGTKPVTTYKLRMPIQPKEFVKGVRLALQGCFIALANPDFKNGRLYKTLFRLLLFTLVAHLVTQILFFLPIAAIGSLLRVLSLTMDTDTTESQRGLEVFSNKAHELMSSIPLLGLLFLRYMYPQPLDNIFIDGLVYSDHLLMQEHEHAKAEQTRNPGSVDPSSPSIYVMDHRGLFAPALLAYPYKVQHWHEMWKYMRRTWKRLKWALLFLVLSWFPIIGRFAFPIASFLSTIQSIGSKPLAVVFGVLSFMLPRSLSIYLLKGFFGCRALTRELLDPYFIRIGMNHYQKRKWFNYRKSVLLGFGVVFYVGCSIPIIGVAVYGLAQQASSAFVLQSLADPPPPPVLKPKSSSPKIPTRQGSRTKQE